MTRKTEPDHLPFSSRLCSSSYILELYSPNTRPCTCDILCDSCGKKVTKYDWYALSYPQQDLEGDESYQAHLACFFTGTWACSKCMEWTMETLRDYPEVTVMMALQAEEQQ